jgi:hypothetical protein
MKPAKFAAVLVLSLSLVASFAPLGGVGAASTPDAARIRERAREALGPLRRYSQGLRSWVKPPGAFEEGPHDARALTPSIGSNVDANDPTMDLAAGQSETGIAASGDRVVVAWNDATAFFTGSKPATPLGSGTGVGYSSDGGATFTDLIGLPNDDPNQQWRGDPSVVAFDGSHFAVASLYFPSNVADCDAGEAQSTVALSVGTVTSGSVPVRFGNPITPADAGDMCAANWRKVAVLDKVFMTYESTSRTLALSYTRFFLAGHHSGLGQIEVVRATVPADPAKLSAADFTRPAVVWAEEPYCDGYTGITPADRCGALDQGAYPAIAPNGDVYVAWERNIDTNLYSGLDPYVYIHAARVPAGATAPDVGGPDSPVVLTVGQANASAFGGVRSMNSTYIAGYNRGTGNDFPRIAVDPVDDRVVFAWNDASAHPLGDIWLRTASYDLSTMTPIRQVNDDRSFAMHFMPALSIGSDGSIRTSWYDRRMWGADSPETDYFGEVRAAERANAPDFKITTGPTDWTNTSTLIVPNFGDYTDNATVGTTTYYTWSDGRLGVPQPFVDSRR